MKLIVNGFSKKQFKSPILHRLRESVRGEWHLMPFSGIFHFRHDRKLRSQDELKTQEPITEILSLSKHSSLHVEMLLVGHQQCSKGFKIHVVIVDN